MGWSKVGKETQSNTIMSSIRLNNELNKNDIERSGVR